MTDTKAITQRLSALYSGIVHDIMRDLNMAHFVLPKSIRPLFPDQTLAGPVFTINGKVHKQASAHDTLVAWTGLLAAAKPGHIWISQPNDDEVAHMGELSAETLALRGVLGCVTDGAVRDVRFLVQQQFPTWSRGFTPRDIVGHWLPDGVDVPITIGDVVIAPGDYVLGDHDGMVVIPSAVVLDVIAAAELAVSTENRVRTAIIGGMDPQQAYLKYGKF